ncbi:MAG: helix-turn-helix transcriptional regulator [Tatlockia sp.]|nr:helix-turn-helix transcriptional regulator [Tatlockia sp.]
MNLQNLKNRALQNQEVKTEYEKLDSEFQLIDSLLTIRKKAGLTQEEVASKMGTKKSNISRLEKGGTNPSWKTLQNYAHACGYEVTMKFKHA